MPRFEFPGVENVAPEQLRDEIASAVGCEVAVCHRRAQTVDGETVPALLVVHTDVDCDPSPLVAAHRPVAPPDPVDAVRRAATFEELRDAVAGLLGGR